MKFDVKHLKVLVICAIIFFVAVVIAIAIPAHDTTDSQDEDESKIIGHWYAMYSTYIDKDDRIVSVSLPNELAKKFDMEIYSCQNGTIYGDCEGESITGTFVNNILRVYSSCHESSFSVGIYLSETHLRFIGVVGDDESMSVYIDYSKDPTKMPDEESIQMNMSLMGNWNLYSDFKQVDEPYSSIHVTLERSKLFAGFFSNGVEFKGVFVKSESYIKGMIITSDNVVGIVELHDEQLTLSIVNGSMCMIGTYVKAGHVGAISEESYSDMVGTEWTTISSSIVSDGGEYRSDVMLFSFRFLEQDGNFVTGEMRYGTVSCDFKAHMSYALGDPTALAIFHFMIDSKDTIGFYSTVTGYLYKDGTAYISFSPSDSSYAQLLKIKEISEDADDSVIGHWYASSAIMIDRFGEISTIDAYNGLDLLDCDFDCLTEKEGLVWIYSREFCTMSNYNNELMINTYIGDTHINGRGWITDGVLFIYMCFTEDHDGYFERDLYFCSYTKEYGAVSVIYPIEVDLIDTWVSIENVHCNQDGTFSSDTGVSTFTIDKCVDGAFTGKLKLTFTSGKSLTYDVSGILVIDECGNIKGWMNSSNGLFWYITMVDENNFSLHTAGLNSVHGSNIDNIFALECMFHRVGTESSGLKQIMNYEGLKCSSTGVIRLSEDGSYSDTGLKAYVSFDEQHYNVIHGKGILTVGDVEYSALITAVVEQVGSEITVRFTVLCEFVDDSKCFGTIFSNDSGSNMVINFFLNGNDYTSMFKMVEVV